MSEINWVLWAQLSTFVIASVGLGLSIYNLARDKAKITVEKHSATLDGDTKVIIYFYLNNIGEKPTTIKSIKFYDHTKFMPKEKLSLAGKKTIPGLSRSLMQYTLEGLEIPFNLMPHSSFKIKAELDFNNKKQRDKCVKKNQIHFNLLIKDSHKVIKKKI